VAAIATPARKAAEIYTGFEAVTKIMADMICGPAIIVMARGRIAWFMAPPCLVAVWVAGPGLGGRQVAVLRLHAAVSWLRNERSLLLFETTVCAPQHKGSTRTSENPFNAKFSPVPGRWGSHEGVIILAGGIIGFLCTDEEEV
jgi:hypothetical protein